MDTPTAAGSAPSEKLEVTVVPGDPVVVRVAGRIMFDTLPTLAEALAGRPAATHPRVVLDLSEVPLCDSSGLNLFVTQRSARLAAGGWLRLAGVQPMVTTVLEITNLTRILPAHPTAEAAIAAD